MKISPARTRAFDILARIEKEHAYSSILLHTGTENLSDADRGLCYELVLGPLRRQIYLDQVIKHFAGTKKVDLEVRISLRLGIFQILFLDRIPPHAVINESVNLVQRAGKSSAKGFVNAILRNTKSACPELSFDDPAEKLSVETSHPRWLVDKWISDFGFEAASKICIANNQPVHPAFRLTARYYSQFGSGESSLESMCKFLGADVGYIKASESISGCFYAIGRATELRKAARNGLIYFQDAGSQLVADVVEFPKNGRFLDLCASPGGKVTKIAADPRYLGAIIVSADYNPARVTNLKANCELQGMQRISVMQIDAVKDLPFVERAFDAVLVDAPCTGTGTIRHNPEIRYRVDGEAISMKKRKQRKMLECASKAVKIGGSLIYSTCSLEREENEEVVTSFLAENQQFTLDKPRVPDRFIRGTHFFRTFPSDFEGDGFFAVVFRRNEA